MLIVIMAFHYTAYWGIPPVNHLKLGGGTET